MRAPQPRRARVERKTRETDIALVLDLDGTGRSRIRTGVGFLDHMLTSLATHARFDLDVRCKGDLHVDAHHSVEDVGIALGQALKQALGDKKGLVRFGHAYVPLDEALSRAVVDLSGRPWLHFGVQFRAQRIGDLPTELLEDFFWALVDHGRFNLHLDLVRYTNNVNVGTAGASATYAGDANHTGSTGSATFAITPAPLMVKANSFTRSYLAADPVQTGTLTGGLGADGITATYNSTGTGSQVPGVYPTVPTRWTRTASWATTR